MGEHYQVGRLAQLTALRRVDHQHAPQLAAWLIKVGYRKVSSSEHPNTMPPLPAPGVGSAVEHHYLAGVRLSRGFKKMSREAARSARESVAAVKDAAGLWKSEGFMAVWKNLFTGQPGFFKDLVALTQGLSNMSMRLAGGGQILVVLVGGKSITIGVVDFIKSSIVDPTRQPIPTPQPATPDPR